MPGMDYQPFHPQITFDEANIIFMNIRNAKQAEHISREEFRYRLNNLLRHTPDSCLCGSIQSLDKKISMLTQAEFDQLCQDTASGKIFFPANYTLPSL